MFQRAFSYVINVWMLSFAALASIAIAAAAGDAVAGDLPLVFQDTFEEGASRWQPSDANAWKVISGPHGKIYNQFRQSDYRPPHRSPLNISLLGDVYVGDFTLEVDLQSTTRDYGHRDMCLFFGYQNAAHFYYVHLGKKADDHANQIFIVNDAPRTKISTRTTPGTDWDDQWHHVKIERRVAAGTIEIYFDDMDEPVMTAGDKTFRWGQVGVGSFDDTGNWDNVKLFGLLVERRK